MKKVLMIIVLSVLLAGCGEKTISWQDAQVKYEEIYSSIIEKAATYESFSADQLSILFNTVAEKIEGLSSGVKADDEEGLISLYSDAVMLEQLSSRSNSLQSRSLSEFAAKAQELIKAAYDKDSSFDAAKSELLAIAQEIQNWTAEDWNLVEIRKKISWAAVEEAYQAMEEEVIENLPDGSTLGETDLEEFKNTILNNYELILDGVNDSNRENADVIYEAAIALREYTADLEGETAEKVFRFASQACEFVKASYGEEIDDPDYDFPALAKDAEKWTLSVWNELVKLLNM